MSEPLYPYQSQSHCLWDSQLNVAVAAASFEHQCEAVLANARRNHAVCGCIKLFCDAQTEQSPAQRKETTELESKLETLADANYDEDSDQVAAALLRDHVHAHRGATHGSWLIATVERYLHSPARQNKQVWWSPTEMKARAGAAKQRTFDMLEKKHRVVMGQMARDVKADTKAALQQALHRQLKAVAAVKQEAEKARVSMIREMDDEMGAEIQKARDEASKAVLRAEQAELKAEQAKVEWTGTLLDAECKAGPSWAASGKRTREGRSSVPESDKAANNSDDEAYSKTDDDCQMMCPPAAKSKPRTKQTATACAAGPSRSTKRVRRGQTSDSRRDDDVTVSTSRERDGEQHSDAADAPRTKKARVKRVSLNASAGNKMRGKVTQATDGWKRTVPCSVCGCDQEKRSVAKKDRGECSTCHSVQSSLSKHMKGWRKLRLAPGEAHTSFGMRHMKELTAEDGILGDLYGGPATPRKSKVAHLMTEETCEAIEEFLKAHQDYGQIPA